MEKEKLETDEGDIRSLVQYIIEECICPEDNQDCVDTDKAEIMGKE